MRQVAAHSLRHSTYRHRFHRRREPVAFVISTSPFVLLLLIIRGGDVSKNPGPADVRRQYTHRHSCTHCGKGVTARSRALSCDNCDQWTHLLCVRSMTPTLYQELCNSGENFDFLCNRCSIGNLPFADVDDILSLTPTSDVSLSLSASISEEEDIFHVLRLLRNRCRNNVIISHLNINSLRHKFHLRLNNVKLNAVVIRTLTKRPSVRQWVSSRFKQLMCLMMWMTSTGPTKSSSLTF